MNESINKLLSNSSDSLNYERPKMNKHTSDLAGLLITELMNMLTKKNGFYALEGALHVFPATSVDEEYGINEWNDGKLWKNDYSKEMTDGCLFFAEDIFGTQFCIKSNKIYTFDPETGSVEYIADHIEGWAEIIMKDYNVLTGYPLAHEWQKKYGRISAGHRLLPKTPFVAGGDYSLDNLYLGDSVTGMKMRADIANQIKGLPEGAQIQFSLED